MKNKVYLYLSGLIVFILLVGLACSSGSATQAPQPPAATAVPSTGNQQPPSGTDTGGAGTSSALVTFTDKNKLYAIDVPGDWKYTARSGTHYYIDRYDSPDQNAFIENVAYDDGTPFKGSQNGQFALQLLHQFYANPSSTNGSTDIHVTDDSIQKDGSERLTWYSSSGNYSGVSFFEVRNNTTFLLFTVGYYNDFKSTYFDVLDKVITSYRTP